MRIAIFLIHQSARGAHLYAGDVGGGQETGALGSVISETGNSVEKGRVWALANPDLSEGRSSCADNGSETDKLTTGLSAVRFLGDRFELHVDGRHQMRQRSEAIQPERPYSSYQTEDASYFAAIGDRIIFTGKRSLVTEYIHQSIWFAAD